MNKGWSVVPVVMLSISLGAQDTSKTEQKAKLAAAQNQKDASKKNDTAKKAIVQKQQEAAKSSKKAALDMQVKDAQDKAKQQKEAVARKASAASVKSAEKKEVATQSKPVVAPKSESKPAVSQPQSKPEAQMPQAPAQPSPAATKAQREAGAKLQALDEGISTLDQEGGNWLLKRQALEKTIDAIEQINKLFTKILQSRMDYLDKRNKADKAFDLFSAANGIKVGELSKLLENLLTDMEDERERQGDLTEDEREVVDALNKKINDVNQLKEDLNALGDLDDSLDEVIEQLEKEITKSHSYQMQAWQNFQKIKQVLSDEKAEELYLQTDGLYKNMQEIFKYLTGQLSTYFDGAVKELQKQMSATLKKIDDLKKIGLDISHEVEKLKDEDIDVARDLGSDADAQVKTPAKKNWFDSIATIWRWPLGKISDFFGYIGSFFSKQTPKVRGQVAN